MPRPPLVPSVPAAALPATPQPDTAALTHDLNQHLGLAPHLSRPTRGVVLPHRAAKLPMPGAHAALLRRLMGGK